MADTTASARSTISEAGGSVRRRRTGRRLSATAVVLAALLVLGACSSEDDADGASTSSSDGATTTSADAQVTTTTGDEGDEATTTVAADGSDSDGSTSSASDDGDGGGDDGSGDGQALPDNAEDWAIATFQAWKVESDTALLELMTEEAYDQLVTERYQVDDGWDEQPQCDGAAGSTYCQFVTGSGDEALILRISNQAVDAGEPAVIEVRFGAAE